MAKHIYQRHGPGGEQDSSMADVMNVGRIQWVIDNFDEIKDGGNSSAYMTTKTNGKTGQARKVIFTKRVNGEMYVVEAVPDTKRKAAWIVTAYMKKAGSETADALAPADTAKTGNQIPTDESIAQTESGVKSGEQRTTATSGTATVVNGGVRLGNGEIVPPPAGMSAEEFAGKLNGLAERRQAQRTAPEEQKEVTLTEALEKIGVTNITGSLADYGNVRSEQNMARAARDAKKYLKKVLKETNADEKTRTFARDMARGLYTEQDIPASMSRDKVKAIADACIDLLTLHKVKLLCIRDRLLFDKQGVTCF